MLRKEINLNKKMIIILLLINILVIGISYSYALFQTNIIKDNAIKLVTGNTNITTTIDGYSNNTITFNASETKTINVTLSNTNTDYEILYLVYYTIESGNGKVSVTNNAEHLGTLKGTKSLTFTIQNIDTTQTTIKITTKGLLQNGNINLGNCLNDNEYELCKYNAAPILNTKLMSYKRVSTSNFTGGLVAINTDGTLYNETSSSEEIREYRYSGLNVNNYVFFDTDGDGVKDDNEIWRIVGIFKNSSNEWNIKLMRNTTLTNSELPATYTYNGTAYKIRYSDTSSDAYWNITKTATNYNDWTTAKLQYFLNASDGYWGTIASTAQSKVNTNYTYYLGNYKSDYVNSNYVSDTTITAYTHERSNTVCSSSVTSNTYTNGNCSIWYGNKATWNGAVALLYPSDYGYSANSSYWNNAAFENYFSGAGTSWMQQSVAHNEWLLSPASYQSFRVASWSGWQVGGYYADEVHYFAVRPVLNLKADTVIDTDHSGSIDDPYLLS